MKRSQSDLKQLESGRSDGCQGILECFFFFFLMKKTQMNSAAFPTGDTSLKYCSLTLLGGVIGGGLGRDPQKRQPELALLRPFQNLPGSRFSDLISLSRLRGEPSALSPR